MATKKEEIVEIKSLDIKTAKIRIVGETPLIVHAWSDKAKQMMLDAQMGKNKVSKKAIRDPFDDFINSLYWLTDKPKESTPDAFEKAIKNGAKFGFPVGAVKQAGNAAAYRLGWVKNQMQLRGSYFLRTEHGEMFEIQGSIPEMREDMVRIGMGSADLRYRAEFKDWYADMILEYNASGALQLSDIINVLSAGGYVCGLGEWRPEKDGSFGKYHVELT